MRSCWRAPCRLFYGHLSFEADWKGEKFDKWVSHELTESKIKIIILKYHLLLLYATTMNHFSIGLWHVMKCGFYVITGDNQLSAWTKKFQSISQRQNCTKKRSWSLFGGLLLVWPSTVFWVPVNPLHLKSMLSKLMRCTENCNTCSWYWSTEWAQIFSMPYLTACLTTNASKVEQIVLQTFALSARFTWPLANRLLLLQAPQQLFAGKNASTTSRRQKMLSKSLLNSKARIFML